MKRILFISIFFIGYSFANAQTSDSIKTARRPLPISNGQTVMRAERVPVKIDERTLIFGDYTISGYSILSLKKPSADELNALIGTVVKIETNSISGSLIDSLSFTIFEIERLRRDDYIYRVFGREI